jgi:hypothetical protein
MIRARAGGCQQKSTIFPFVYVLSAFLYAPVWGCLFDSLRNSVVGLPRMKG